MGKKSRQKIINRELKIQNQEKKKGKRKKVLKISLITILALAILGGAGFAAWKYHLRKKTSNSGGTKTVAQSQNIDNQIAVLDTSMGTIKFRLLASAAPKTVDNFVKLANQGFYDGTKFHRVISGFMIQGGDPLSKDESKIDTWGTGGPGYTFPDEPVIGDYIPGTVAMANSGPNTNGSQFFIMAGDWSNGKLAKNYNIFGSVTEGMDAVQKIDAVKTNSSDRPLDDVTINKVTIETDNNTTSPSSNSASGTPITITNQGGSASVGAIQAVTSDGTPINVTTAPAK